LIQVALKLKSAILRDKQGQACDFIFKEDFMARKPRLHFPGAVYHVTLHGNGNQPVFLDATDHW